MTTNNIRNYAAAIARQLIDPEVSTSEVAESVSILRDAIRVRQFITNAENAHHVLMAAMTGDAVSVCSASCILEDYNLASERALHEIARADEKLGKFEKGCSVSVTDLNDILKELDELLDKPLYK